MKNPLILGTEAAIKLIKNGKLNVSEQYLQQVQDRLKRDQMRCEDPVELLEPLTSSR
jgi:hypothetical protein